MNAPNVTLTQGLHCTHIARLKYTNGKWSNLDEHCSRKTILTKCTTAHSSIKFNPTQHNGV